MLSGKRRWRLGLCILVVTALCAGTRPFRVYLSLEPHDDVPLPTNWDEKTELVLGRLMYPPHPYARFGRRGGGYWLVGSTSWTVDYPRGDRHFAEILRRLTRIHTRTAEQPINLDDDNDVYHYPWLYVNLPGSWKLTDSQVAKLRDYLLRGGFLMADNFFGPAEWDIFLESMQKVFPDREIEDLEGEEQIFHTVYDLSRRMQIPGWWALRNGRMNRDGGTVDYWRGIRDDRGRLMVAISFNSDVGDSWEWADDHRYPEQYSALGLRLGVNYVVYAMTH